MRYLILWLLLTPLGDGPSLPASTELVSVSTVGVQGDGLSRRAARPADDRYVAFLSDATDLVAGDDNGVRDVFLRDRSLGRTQRVSLAFDGEEGNGNSFDPAVSTNARRIAFESTSTNLVPNDDNLKRDIFLRDRDAGTTERLSVATDGTEADDASFIATMSRDGVRVAFRSSATNLVDDDQNAAIDIFLRDVDAGTTVRVSVATDGTEADGSSNRPSISPDGNVIAFESAATNLVDDDDNGRIDVFVRDLVTGMTERVSVATDGTEGDGDSRSPMLSFDGRYVVFESAAENLVDDDMNASVDIFRHDRMTGETIRVSLSASGDEGQGDSVEPAIDDSGDLIAFASDAPNLVSDDQNATRDIFARRVGAGKTARVSVDSGGGEVVGTSERPVVTPDGRMIAFDSDAPGLVVGDTDALGDVFVRDSGDGAGLVCRAGNVNAGVGETDVLRVNGSAGHGAERALALAPNDAFEIRMEAPPSNPSGPSRFVLYAWVGWPNRRFRSSSARRASRCRSATTGRRRRARSGTTSGRRTCSENRRAPRLPRRRSCSSFRAASASRSHSGCRA